MSHDLMLQEAPFPYELDKLVQALQYRPGWHFELRHLDRGQGSMGLTFSVYTVGYNTYHPEQGQTYRVVHYFPVPPASYNRESWSHWLLDRLLEVERHECCEFFQIKHADGVDRPFAPNHGPGWDPYIVLHMNTPEAAATRFTGERTDLDVPEGWEPREVGIHVGADGVGELVLELPPEVVTAAQVLGARGTAGFKAHKDPTLVILLVADAHPGTTARVRYFVEPDGPTELPRIAAVDHSEAEVQRLSDAMDSADE